MIQQNNIAVPIIGMSSDKSENSPVKNSYNFGLNLLNNSSKGDIGTIVNEHGTTERFTFSNNEVIIGHISVDNSTTILFTSNGVDSHSIGKWFNNSYTQLISDQCLNFSTDLKFRITGEYRIVNGCDEVIYFRDSLNPDRRINLSAYDDGLYNDSTGNFDCNLIELNPDFIIPNFTATVLNAGSLKPGAYQFSISYLDNEFNVVYRSYLSLPTFVIKNQDSSIELLIENIDTKFAYFNIYVAIATSGTGTATEFYCIKNNQPIQNSIYSFHFTNLTSEDVRVTLDELLQQNIVYETSKVMEQVDGRLLRANLTEKYRPYNLYQQYANAIDTQWVSKIVDSRARERSFMGGEVEAFGIVYIHTNGQESPVFNIPCKTTYSLLPSVPAYHRTGTCDPHITQSTYTNPNCADTYWDIQGGGTLSNQNIKHFVTPDRGVITLGGLDQKGIIGYEFSNIQYPDDVIGHYIVKAKRNYSNKTIYSKGFAGTLNNITSSTGMVFRGMTYLQPSEPTASTKHLWFTSPELQYKRKEIQSTHFNKILEFRTTEYNIDSNCESGIGNVKYGKGNWNCMEYDGNGSAMFGEDTDIIITASYLKRGAQRIDSQSSTILKSKFFEYNESSRNIFETATTVINTSMLNPFQFIYTNSDISWVEDDQGSLFYVSLADNDKIVFDDLYSIEYVRTHNGMKTGDTVIFEGETWVSPPFIANVLLESEGTTAFLDKAIRVLGSGIVGAASALGATISTSDAAPNVQALSNSVQSAAQSAGVGGPQAALIAAGVGFTLGVTVSTIREIAALYKDNALGDLTNFTTNTWKFPGPAGHLYCRNGDIRYHAEVLTDLVVESEIDTNLREIETVCGDIYDVNSLEFLGYIRDKLLTYSEDIQNYVINGTVCPEIYRYNYDYSKKNYENVYYPLPFTYNFCSDCINKYPNTIIYSSLSSNVFSGDAYTLYKPGAEKIIDGDKGEITNLTYSKNRLYIHTTDDLYITRPNHQQLNTGSNGIIIESGAFLSLTPEKLSNAEYGAYGCLNGSVLKIPSGITWVDSNSSRIYLHSSNLNNLNYKGLNSYLQSKSPLFGKDHSVLIAYDNKYDRILYSVKSFKLIEGQDSSEPTSNVDRYENQSFTLSYSLMNKSWTSFHSYIPDYLFSNSTTVFSSIGSTLYSHDNETVRSNYYGIQESSILDYTLQFNRTSIIDSIQYYSEVVDENEAVLNETYDNLVVYSSNQSTGLLNLQLETSDTVFNLGWDPTNKSVIKSNNLHKVAAIRDIGLNSNIFTSDWNNIQSNYFIDKVPTNLDLTRQEWQLKRIIDNYIGIRLYYNGSNKIKTNFISTVTVPNIL